MLVGAVLAARTGAAYDPRTIRPLGGMT